MAGDLTIEFAAKAMWQTAEMWGKSTVTLGNRMRTIMEASINLLEAYAVDFTPVNLGHARQSIDTMIHGSPPNIRGTVVMNVPYGMPLEYGRKVGKWPPLGAIAYWLYRKGIVKDRKELRSVAFLVARAIGQGTSKGIMRPDGGARMFEQAFKKGKPKIEALWNKLLVDVLKGQW